MSHTPPAASPPARRAWGRPWPILVVALGLVIAAAIFACLRESALTPLRVSLLLAALILAGCSVRLALKRRQPDLDARLEAASVIAVASLVPLVGYFATGKEPTSNKVNAYVTILLHNQPLSAVSCSSYFLTVPEDWDSLRMVDTTLIVVAVLGAVLILLPSVVRRVVISILVLIHFGGILVAVTSVEPPNQPGPWLSGQLWTYFYRPYLGFMYLNNAYHFYSPEPGPPTLMWNYLIYSNGKERVGRWVKIPDRETSPVPLHHQRLLALTESINVINQQVPDAVLNQKLVNRQSAGEADRIPMHPEIAPFRQYQEPQPYSKLMTASYARHLIRTYPELPGLPEYKVQSVKIYRVIHNVLEARFLALGFSPLDKTLYYPYFMGEFNARGELVNPNDHFLYWLIPILRDQKPLPAHPQLPAPPSSDDPDEGLHDNLQGHARLDLAPLIDQKPAGK